MYIFAIFQATALFIIIQVTALLPALIRTSHILMYAFRDSFTCRLAVT